MPDLSGADALAAAVAYLGSHPVVLREFGPGRVGGTADPPYPRIRLTDTPGGSDRDLTWLLEPEVAVEVLGDLDGTPGKAELRRLLYVVLGALADMPFAPAAPGRPVVTSVRSAAAGGWSPTPLGQPRYVATLLVGVHPAVA